jgi:hypothetical protein
MNQPDRGRTRRRVVQVVGSSVVADDRRELSPAGAAGGGRLSIHSTAEGVVPAPGESRASILRMAPNDMATFDSAVVERFGKYADPSRPGMHTTPTLDYSIVLRGPIVLELSETEVVLETGDITVLDQAPHRWRNDSTEDVEILFVLTGRNAPD